MSRSGRPALLPALGRAAWILSLSLAGCTAPGDPPAAPVTVRLPIDRDVTSLDPTAELDVVTHGVLRLVYEGLTDIDPVTLEPAPRLAESWSSSQDGRVWRFTLRAGARFPDDPCFESGKGRPVVATDARDAIERALRALARQGRGAHLPPIEGLETFLGRTDGDLSGVAVLDDRTLEIRLARPDPALLPFLGGPWTFVVPHEAIERYGPELARRTVGSGPFRVAAFGPVTGVLLVRRADAEAGEASDEATRMIDALRLIVAADSFRRYAAGELDAFFTYDFEPPEEDTRPGEQRFLVPWLNTIYFRFDFRSDHPAVRDPRLRRAIALAAPRSEGRWHRPARHLLPPELAGAPAPGAAGGQRTDPESARRLLAEAGHPNAGGLPPLRLAYPADDDQTGRRFAAALRDLGFRVEPVVLPRPEIRRAAGSGRFDLFRDGWVADYPDAEDFLQLFYSRSPHDLGGFRDEAFDRGFERLRRETDRERRRALARRLDQRLVERAAAVFLRHERQLQLVAPRLAGWDRCCANPLNVPFYERLRVRP